MMTKYFTSCFGMMIHLSVPLSLHRQLELFFQSDFLHSPKTRVQLLQPAGFYLLVEEAITVAVASVSASELQCSLAVKYKTCYLVVLTCSVVLWHSCL